MVFSFISAYSAQSDHSFRNIVTRSSRGLWLAVPLNCPLSRSEATLGLFYFAEFFPFVKGERIFLIDSPFKLILCAL